jgi:uncharacterized protein YjbI with pentapeptide repeats
MISRTQVLGLTLLFCLTGTTAWGQIYRWDNGQVIPGTEGITPGPGVVLDHRDLSVASLFRRDLSNARFDSSNLSRANLHQSTLNGANLYQANLFQADLEHTAFANANLSGTNLTSARLSYSTLTGADLSGAALTNANFYGTTGRGFTQAQLASTASYKAKDLRRIDLGFNNLSGWDFSGQNLTDSFFRNASLSGANLRGADFTNASLWRAWLPGADVGGAVVTGADFSEISAGGFTQAQLASTASYLAKNLERVRLSKNDLTGWDFNGQNLTHAHFEQSTVVGANFSGAAVTGANFIGTTSRGFTEAQLASTASYQVKNLQGVVLADCDLSGWNFRGQNLTNAVLSRSKLANADLSGAIVAGADFFEVTSNGFTQTQLKSTSSYEMKNLRGIRLVYNDLTGWDLSGQDITGADLTGATLVDTNFKGARIAGVAFPNYSLYGFTQAQLASTASYQTKNLTGIGLWGGALLIGWDFRNQNLSRARLDQSLLTDANLSGASLVNAHLSAARLTGADLAAADLRGAYGVDLAAPSANYRNAILPNGSIARLELSNGERLVVRDEDGTTGFAPREFWITPRAPIPVTIQDHLAMSPLGVLQLQFEADPWDSLISFEPGIPVELGGTLELTFADDVDVATQIGRTLRIFDWTGVAPVGQFQVGGPHVWDVTNLYTTGEVTLAAVPEPASGVLLVMGSLAMLAASGRRAISSIG